MSRFTPTVSGLLTLAVMGGLIALPAIAGDCGSKATQVAKGEMDIVDTAVAAGDFTTLVKAVQAAGLVDTLKSDGPWTVFAPTDEAFAAIPSETLTALIANKDQLTQVLTYHVVAGEVTAAQVVQLDAAKTVQGQSLTIDTSSGVKVDNANVIVTDIQCSNGVIHVIDAVVLPS